MINLFRHDRAFINALRRLARSGEAKVPAGVFLDIVEGCDALVQIVQSWKEKYRFSVPIKVKEANPRAAAEFGRICRQYGDSFRIGNQTYAGFDHQPRNRHAADQQLVALAKVEEGSIVVSDDLTVRAVCHLEGIECIGWLDFARRLKSESGRLF